MKRAISILLSVILLAASSGCLVAVDRDDGDRRYHDRGGYGDRDRDRDWDRDRDRRY